MGNHPFFIPGLQHCILNVARRFVHASELLFAAILSRRGYFHSLYTGLMKQTLRFALLLQNYAKGHSSGSFRFPWRKNPPREYNFLSYAIPVISLALLSGGIVIYITLESYERALEDKKEAIARELQAIARTTASLMDARKFETLFFPQEVLDQGEQAYRKYLATVSRQSYFAECQAILRRVIKANQQLGFTQDNLYVFALDPFSTHHTFFWAIMAHPEPFVGKPYQPRPETLPVLQGRRFSQVTDVYYSPVSGREWISAFAPLFGPDGRLLGIVEVAREVNDLLAETREIHRNYLWFILGDGVVGAIVIGLLLWVLGSLNRTNRRLHKENAERRGTEKELKIQKALLDQLFESTPEGIALLNEHDRVVRVNPAFSKIFGFTAQEVIGKRLSELIVPENLRDESQHLNQLVSGGKTVAVESVRRRKDGRLVDVSILGAPVVMEDGQMGVYGIYLDISERKKAERRLKYRSELDNLITHISARFLNAPLQEIDKEVNRALHLIGRFVGADRCYVYQFSEEGKKALKTHGWSREGLPQQELAFEEVDTSSWPWFTEQLLQLKPIWWTSPKKVPDQAERERNSMISQGIQALVAVPIIRNHQAFGFLGLEVIQRNVEWPDELLSLFRVAGEIVANTLNRKHFEEQLAQLAYVTESIGEFVVIVDFQGRITWVNKPVLEKFGYREEELLGRMALVFFSKKYDLDTLQEMFNHSLKGSWRSDVLLRTREGEEFWASLSTSLLKHGEMPVGVVGIFSDITARKQAEEAIRKAKEQAEEASRLKSEFLANMSHEIRTPMNGIIGMTELLLDTPLSKEQRDYLETVKASADSLLALLNDILDFSKIEAGKLELYPVDVCFPDFLGEIMKTLAFRGHQKGLEVAYYVDPSVPEYLRMDPVRMRQVLVNLVGNAIKFTEEGEVVLRVWVEKKLSEQKYLLHFSVSDTGIGIPPEKQKIIFDAFAQADGSDTRKYGGTGLGLSISAKLVDLMGGRIWVQSPARQTDKKNGKALPAQTTGQAPGGPGTTFHFLVQVEVSTQKPQNTLPASSLAQRPRRVLIVDDNATNREILRVMLNQWGLHPHVASSAMKALEIVHQWRKDNRFFDLLILDAQMPEVSGFQLAAELRELPEYKKRPIMILTSADSKGDAQLCQELAIQSFLTKPVKSTELKLAVFRELGILLQEQAQSSPSNTTRPGGEGKTARLRIIVAEDNPVNQKLACRLLEKLGHEVFLASNGKEALALWQQHDVDLILMDVQMPEMDGLTATRKIREMENGFPEPIPIIALTAYAMKGDRERCLEAGMTDYLSKPLKIKELKEKLKFFSQHKSSQLQHSHE